jgi:hypothetical protein
LEAHRYPLHAVWFEAELTAGHLNNQIATAAVLTQLAVSSMFSKKAGKAFENRIKELTGNGKA